MLNIIEVGPQVDIDDSHFVFHDCLSYPLDRLMRCPLRPVAVRPRLEIGFEYRLQDKLEGSLDYAIADTRNRKDADLRAPVLRYLLLPCP